MRKFKFRAWDKRKNKWIHRDTLIMTNAGFYEDYREFDAGNSLFDYEYELLQYTGLKDKNDKDIFEGDIVTEKYGNEYGVGKVVFEDGAFWVHFLDDEYLLIGCDSEQTEVIGNIYENPELIPNN